MAKTLRETTLQNPSSEKINREQLIKTPGVSIPLSVSNTICNTICLWHNFYCNFTDKCDVFQESFAEQFFSKYDVLFGWVPQPWYQRGVQQGADRQNFQTDVYLKILSTVSYMQCLCHLVYASNIESWFFKIGTFRKRAFFRYRET